MLLRFSVANFRSFWCEQQLSMIASSLKDDPSGLIEAPALRGEKLLPSAVIYGANASGKSNLLRALSFMLATIRNSHTRGGPETKIERGKFALSPDSVAEASRFSLEFLREGVRYEYGFAVFDDHFETEWLHWWPSGVRSNLFNRRDQQFDFGRSLKGRHRIFAELTRKNSLFLSVALQNNHEQLIEIANFFRSVVFTMHGFPGSSWTAPDFRDPGSATKTMFFLRELGTGIRAFEFGSRPPSEFEKAVRRAIIERRDLKRDLESVDVALPVPHLRFGHRGLGGDEVFFDIEDESDGTRWLAETCTLIFTVLDNGGLIVIDEFGAKIHTLAADAILGLFASKETNPKGAQLIVATHDTNLLSSRHIRRDQVWFTEKDKGGATMLTPLTDIQTRKGDDIEKGYLQGRYGAIPFAQFDPATLKAD